MIDLRRVCENLLLTTKDNNYIFLPLLPYEKQGSERKHLSKKCKLKQELKDMWKLKLFLLII